MIAGLPMEYACARVTARLARRPDERLWQQVHSARTISALIDMLRNSVAATYVGGLTAANSIEEIELALRQQLRARIVETATWVPDVWRSAVLWTRHLIDLPAIASLHSSEAQPRWVARDPILSRYVEVDTNQGRVRIEAGPLRPIVAAIESERQVAATSRRQKRASPVIHTVLARWVESWREQWPAISQDERWLLDRLVSKVERHVAQFAAVSASDAWGARLALAHDVALHLRKTLMQPAMIFAYLVLVALDLERLRGELCQRVAAATQSAP